MVAWIWQPISSTWQPLFFGSPVSCIHKKRERKIAYWSCATRKVRTSKEKSFTQEQCIPCNIPWVYWDLLFELGDNVADTYCTVGRRFDCVERGLTGFQQQLLALGSPSRSIQSCILPTGDGNFWLAWGTASCKCWQFKSLFGNTIRRLFYSASASSECILVIFCTY